MRIIRLHLLFIASRLFSWKGIMLMFFIVLMLDLAGILFLAYFTQIPRIFPIGEFGDGNTYSKNFYLDFSDPEKLKAELVDVVNDRHSDKEKAFLIMKWVMNQIEVQGSAKQMKSSYDALVDGRNGVGLACSQMAQIYRDSLLSIGIPARRIILQRNLFDTYDTHVAVEVFWKNEWHLMDPTYHLAFVQDGAYVGVNEVRDWWLRRKGAAVEAIFLGNVKYPARYLNVPFRYESYFNNVYIEFERSFGYKRMIPIVGIWLGPQWAYFDNEPGVSLMPQVAYRILYYSFMLLIPVLLAILILLGFLLYKRSLMVVAQGSMR